MKKGSQFLCLNFFSLLLTMLLIADKSLENSLVFCIFYFCTFFLLPFKFFDWFLFGEK